jgi:hypothetical protein
MNLNKLHQEEEMRNVMKKALKSKTIPVEKSVGKTTPQEFKALKSTSTYRLQKIGAKKLSMVDIGQFVEGECKVVEVCGTKQPGVLVANPSRYNDYIRTSPVVRVLLATKKNIVFETEGGFYELTTL